jgi:hypothetical protein
MEPSADASENVRRFERWAGTYVRSWVQRYLDQLHQTVLDLAWAEPGDDPPGVCWTSAAAPGGCFGQPELVGQRPSSSVLTRR